MTDRPIPVCVFAKPPRPGSVKTRLELGGARTALLARAFFLDTWAMVRSLPWARPILAATEGGAEDFGLPADTEVWLQGDGDLGERLERVLARALRGHPFALALGADTPGLPRRLLEYARSALASGEAVLGPCEDGGFYLLGLRRCPPGLLRDLPWSATETFIQTLGRLCEWGMAVSVLEPWFDVDRPPDLQRLRRSIERGEISAPETAAALTSMGYPVRRGRGAVAAR